MDIIINKIKKNSEAFICAFIFLLSTAISMLYPYTHDDWAWGCKIGIERLSNWFDGHNGRYLGNLIELAITRSVLLKSVFMGITVALMVYLITRIIGRNRITLGLICCFFIFMPSVTFRQTFAWAAGFANYVVSALLVFIYLYYNRNLLEKRPKSKALDCVLLSLLGLAGTLIVEHFTFYTVVLGFSVIAYSVFRYRKVAAQHIFYFVASLAGTVWMLSNSAYRTIVDRNDSYRTVAHSVQEILFIVRTNFKHGIVPYGFLKNSVLTVALALVCLAIVINVWKKSKTVRRIILTASLLYMFFYAALSVYYTITDFDLGEFTNATAFVLMLVLFVFVFALPVKTDRKIRLAFYLVSIVAINFPLLFITPVNPRCFFGVYVFLSCFILELLDNTDDKTKAHAQKLGYVALVAAAVGFVYLFCIYLRIHTVDVNRVEKARIDAQTSNAIEVVSLPYEKYTWLGTPKEELWDYRFKLFYGIDPDVQITYVPFSQE